MATRRKIHYSATELKAFRRDLAALKRAGIVPRNVKTSEALPSQIRNGKRLDDYIKKFGAATPSQNAAEIVTVSRAEAGALKKVGYKVQGSKVMVPRGPTETVSIQNGHIVVRDEATGFERVQLPVEYHNLTQFFRDLEKHTSEIQRMKRANERFGFRFFGSNSHQTFRRFEHLLEFLHTYDAVRRLLNKRNAREARDLYQNLEIVRIPTGKQFDFMNDRKLTPRKGFKRSKAERRANWPEWRKEQYKAKRRAEEKARRARKKAEKK